MVSLKKCLLNKSNKKSKKIHKCINVFILECISFDLIIDK